MRLPVLIAILTATPVLAQSAAPQTVFSNRGRETQLGRQGPTVVAEPIAVALAAFDADQDGLVTRNEANIGATRSFAAVAGGGADMGYIGYSAWAARFLGDANAAPGPYAVDTDRNNRITAAELAAALLETFDRFDANKDGTLTRAELITVRATVFGDDRDRKGRRKPAQ